ncbi:UNVERIFIED_CONTAM: RNA methyltransferase [Escherichia coli]|uniref:RNA methyltransferase n=1 Tax=Niallia circulans TaxID=1397 RepID=A0A941GHD7_NIACI|nr:RNA methyltransferase [Niallia circulans]EOR25448.1 23S rRNA methyltransferase [Niallia nealsonii AAU1]MCB5238094.1 RNA methyltransferase [Niallia circulans]MDU1844227.1 RNA methyltransferase [Niallia nealsonii]
MKHILSVKNPQVKEWKKRLTKKEREKTGTFLVEGFHLVEEAFKAEAIIDLIISEEIDVPSWDYGDIPITIVTKEIIKELSDTETPQGIFALCRQFDYPEILSTAQTFIAIDQVQDPGNMGTIIRTADAAGVDAVIIGEGTVDIYNPKVVRSGQGSHFHLPIVKTNLSAFIDALKERHIPVYGTALENGRNYREIEKTDTFCLILGNEGSGVSKQVLSKTDTNLYIPIHGKSESLNVAVAAGILMYYFK